MDRISPTRGFGSPQRGPATADEVGSVANSWETSTTKNQVLPLSARSFFKPILPGRARGSNWPEKLTIEKQKISLEEAKIRVQGEWIYRFSCNGKPVDNSHLAKLQVYEGYHHDRAEMHIDKNSYAVKRFPGEKQEGDPAKVKSSDSVKYKLKRSPNSATTFDMFFYPPDIFHFPFNILEFGKIKETGEPILMFRDPHGTDSFPPLRCPDGGLLDTLLVPKHNFVS